MRKQNKPWHVEKAVPGVGTEITPVGYESLIASSKPDYSPENLKALRRSLNMTQAELAKRAKVKQSTVSFFERGNEKKAGPGARARIAGVLIQAEFDRSIGKYGAPSADEKIKHLEARIAVLERNLGIAKDYEKRLEAQNDALMDILGLREKKILTEESEQQKIDALGLEKLPPVEEQEMREEIEQRGKAKSTKEK